MGQISAEARGLVKVALQQVEVGIGGSLPQRPSAALEKRWSKQPAFTRIFSSAA